MRYGIGTDYFSYKRIFENINNGLGSRTEIGYNLINYIIGHMGGNIQTVFFVVSFVTILFIYLSLCEHKGKISVGIGMLVFMLLYYQMSYNVVRQVLAMAISLYSVKYIFNRQLIKFIGFTLLGASIHLSVICLFPFYFIYKFFGERKRVLVQLLFFSIIFILISNYDKILTPIINKIPELQYYNHYLVKKEDISFGFGVVALNIPYIMPGIVFYKNIIKYENRFIFYYILMCVGFLLKFMGYFAANYANRIADVFFISVIIIIPYYIKMVRRNKELSFINIFIITFLFFMWIFTYFYSGWGETVPYQSILFK